MTRQESSILLLLLALAVYVWEVLLCSLGNHLYREGEGEDVYIGVWHAVFTQFFSFLTSILSTLTLTQTSFVFTCSGMGTHQPLSYGCQAS